MQSFEHILEEVARWAGEPVTPAGRVGGGSIAGAHRLLSNSGRPFFVKTYGGNPALHRCEANGLREIAASGSIRVPEVLLEGNGFLLMEFIPGGELPPDFFHDFARRLAGMHRHTRTHFGFYEDNFIGATPQPNAPGGAEDNWAHFYWEERLLFQLKLAEKQGLASPKLIRNVGGLESRLENLLKGSEEPPALLHGDLWRGNFMVAENGDPVLIDPAVYYGHREADLGMTMLFGGFPGEFYDAYQEVWSMAPGWRERMDLYKLYHVLNHLNLFGGSYLSQAESLALRYL
ncbi:MAG TPA: fructosamine kinase family protein [Calditrichia bacterium]|nr:fructosamine kinase family protein [Calditrichia bacterium]